VGEFFCSGSILHEPSPFVHSMGLVVAVEATASFFIIFEMNLRQISQQLAPYLRACNGFSKDEITPHILQRIKLLCTMDLSEIKWEQSISQVDDDLVEKTYF
jgi:hypothetical protein